MLDLTDQRLRQREFLLRISRALTAQLDLTTVLNLVIDVAVELLAGTSGLIALREGDDGEPRGRAAPRPCAEVLAIHTPQGVNICLVDCPLQRRPLDPNPVVEGWITARDGRRLYVQSRYAVQYGPKNEFQGAIANVRDITEQKMEEELQNTFISVISHELKTPVSIIRGYAEALGREDADWDRETLREGLAVISDEADRLARQIADLQ